MMPDESTTLLEVSNRIMSKPTAADFDPGATISTLLGPSERMHIQEETQLGDSFNWVSLRN